MDELGPPNSGRGGRPRKPAVDPERRAEVVRQLGLDDNDENRAVIELDLLLRDERWLAGGPGRHLRPGGRGEQAPQGQLEALHEGVRG